MNVLERWMQNPEYRFLVNRESITLETMELLLETMEENGITYERISDLAGISVADFRRILRGDVKISLLDLGDLFYALGKKIKVTVEDLEYVNSDVGI